MRNTQPIPTCPNCGANVYRTHTCRVSGLRRHANGMLPEKGEQLPAARPLQLVPMPEGWRDQVRAELEPVPSWPARAQLELVTEDDLDWGDDPEAGRASLSTILGALALAITVAVPVLIDSLVQL